MVSKGQHFANLARKMLEEELVHAAIHAVDKHRQIGRKGAPYCDRFLLATTPWLSGFVTIAYNIVLLAVHAIRFRLVALLLTSSTSPTACF